MSISQTFIKYGVSDEIARELENKGLTKTKVLKTSLKALITNYDLESSVAAFVKDCVKRKPIADEIIQQLLENSYFSCCICKGNKSDAYIIHHIVPYSKTKDNKYDNLAVLCPNDHDLAHREGIALTNKITEKQVRMAKVNWEKEVKEKTANKLKQSASELDRIDKSKVSFISRQLHDNKAINIECDHKITTHTKFILIVDQTTIEQEFVTYVSIKTDQGDHKWIGFATALALKNVYSSERVYRVGRPGKKHYEFVEYIYERINESGLVVKGQPILINQVRLWGWHNNNQTLNFKFALLD
ncbi:MAG: HNH endonuclease [Bacteroidia bacterium]